MRTSRFAWARGPLWVTVALLTGCGTTRVTRVTHPEVVLESGLRYEDLVRDPVAQMRALYDHLGLGGFEELLPKGTSAELAKVYLAETTAARAQLADMEHRAAKDRAGNEHR